MKSIKSKNIEIFVRVTPSPEPYMNDDLQWQASTVTEETGHLKYSCTKGSLAVSPAGAATCEP